MRMFTHLVLLLGVHSVFCLSSNRFTERLNYIEDRINVESKFRRDDFSTLFNEISSVKTMLQQLMDNKHESEDNTKVESTENSQLELDVQLLKNGFKEEKKLNIRIRREIPVLQRHVQDLKTKSEQISASLVNILKGIEFLKEEKVEREETFDLFQKKIPEIQKNIIDLHEEFEQTKAAESESLDKIKTGTEELKENIDHLKHSHKQCLESIDINNNMTRRLEEIFVSENMFRSEGKDSYDAPECNCSVVSDPVTSTPSPDNQMTTSPKDKMITHKSCLDLYDNGYKADGIYQIKIKHAQTISVYCDMTTDGGGWTVFQRRKDGSVDFFLGWNDYKKGFGNLDVEFWLGNEYLNLLTDNDESHELRIELGDHDGNRVFAKYSSFKVMSENNNFTLEVSGYAGNAGDSLTSDRGTLFQHNGMGFSTKDMDNDTSSAHCASKYRGAWWFNSCFDSNLNGPYENQPNCKSKWKCVIWYSWKGNNYSIKLTEMKFR